MKRILFVGLFFVIGYGSVEVKACEELRKYPSLYEELMNQNARGMKELGKLKVVAVTLIDDSQKDTYLFVKSEAVGEVDIYLLQRTNKNCNVIDQSVYFDYQEVKRIVRQKKMKKL